MTKEKKKYKAVTIRMDAGVAERLEKYCEQSGQSKTVAIERAVDKFIDDYNKQMEKLASQQ